MTENPLYLFTIQHLINKYKKTKINIVVLILRYHGTKTSFWFWCVLSRYLSSYICKHVIFLFTLHIICKSYHLPSATEHFNNRYKFKIIHICSSNANEKLILGFKFSLLWQSKFQTVNFYIKTTFKSILSFFSKCVYEQYLQSLNKRNSLFYISKKGIINVPNLRYHGKNRTISNFTLKTLFPKQFIYFKSTSIYIFHTNDNGNQYQR